MSDQFATPNLLDPPPVTGAKVYCVICIAYDESEVCHIFSTLEKRAAFMAADTERAHVLYDYVIDCPERMEGRTQ